VAITIKSGRIRPATVLRGRNIDVTLDTSYPTGGYALTAADVGFTNLYVVLPMAVSSGGWAAQYDFGTEKLVVWRTAGHTHVENTAGTYTQNATTASQSGTGAFQEVTAGTNLSTVVVRLFVLGE
jgi:hypothetical protein